MKSGNFLRVITSIAVCGLAVSAHATLIVQDTWQDSNRTEPPVTVTSPFTTTYSEDGVDQDGDGDRESLWFRNGSSAGAGVSPGHLIITNAAASANAFTYFTSPGAPLTLANAGDSIKVTWTFTPSGVNVVNTGQNFKLAVANSQTVARNTVDGSAPTLAPGGANSYAGYSMFMNMGNTLANGNPFQLREWVAGSAGSLLGTSANWSAGLANGATSGNHGYDSGTSYTYTMTLSLLTGGNLEVNSRMQGGTLNGVGFASTVFTDSTPNTLTYDMFNMRTDSAAGTATFFDTSLFQVEFTTVPEPSTLALVGAGLGLIAMIRRRRR